MVILDASAPCGSWPLGRVLEVFADKHGLVRFVRLQSKSSITERTIRKLCLLHGKYLVLFSICFWGVSI